MTTELPKTYDPSSVETETYRVWLEENAFAADPNRPGKPYCIVIPPPNVTGALHIGHAINNTLQDILIRQHRMAGYNTLWLPGIDHAGIATQAVVEKELKEKENKTRHDVGREALVARIWAWKEQYANRILEQLKRLGCSCDWSRTRFTLDDQCARAVRETFFKLFKDGLIYRGKRLVNWDTFLQTSVSDDEIYHETVKTSLWYLKYPIVDDDKAPHVHAGLRVDHMVVATTRPETMLGDTAVAVHPDDPRWNWAIGKHVRLPLMDRLIPVIADSILVDPKFGTGCVKVTPACDQNDYACWQRQNNNIDILQIITPDGHMNDKCGKYAGLPREKARKQVVADLQHQGLLLKEEPYETQVGHSDRSKTPIEPYLSDQWFVKMAPLAEPALQVVRDHIIQFFPERYANTYLDWLGEKRDWPISRQLWWGHRIPVWKMPLDFTDSKGNEPGLTQRMAKFAEYLKADRIAYREREQAFTDRTMGLAEYDFVAIRNQDDLEVQSFLEANGFVQDPDVLDTWFSSALWPHSTLGWPDDTPELRKYYPTAVLCTARDIITLWVARMVMTGLYNMGTGSNLAIPFHHVYINPTILDGKGERMSKSKGNGVDPVDIIQTHGADALRFTLTTMATQTQDVRLPVKKLPDGRNTSDKFDIGRNFCNKLFNAARFALTSLGGLAASAASEPVDETKWTLPDHWIVSRFNRTLQQVNDALSNYRFDQYAHLCYDFFWSDFCDWYVEITKPALKDPNRAAQTAHVLAAVLDGALRLMHPMIPFITERLWWRLCEIRPTRDLPHRIAAAGGSPRLIRAPWPTVGPVSDHAESLFTQLQEIIVAIRNVRNDYKIDPRKSVAVAILAPTQFAPSITDNREMIQLLSTCTLEHLRPDLPAPPGAVRTLAAGCEIFMQGLVDANADQQRLGKRREELTAQITALQARLANPNYVSKAPPHLVQQTNDQLDQARSELAKLT